MQRQGLLVLELIDLLARSLWTGCFSCKMLPWQVCECLRAGRSTCGCRTVEKGPGQPITTRIVSTQTSWLRPSSAIHADKVSLGCKCSAYPSGTAAWLTQTKTHMLRGQCVIQCKGLQSSTTRTHQLTRTSKPCINKDGHEGAVQAPDIGEASKLGIRHALWDNHSAHRQP